MIVDSCIGRAERLTRFDRKDRMQPCAVTKRQNALGNFVHRIPPHESIANDAVHGATAGIEQAHVVVDFGCRRDRGAGIACLVLLLDGDGRGQAVDQVDIRLLDSFQKLARVSRQRFDIAPLTFRIDRIERQR